MRRKGLGREEKGEGGRVVYNTAQERKLLTQRDKAERNTQTKRGKRNLFLSVKLFNH